VPGDERDRHHGRGPRVPAARRRARVAAVSPQPVPPVPAGVRGCAADGDRHGPGAGHPRRLPGFQTRLVCRRTTYLGRVQRHVQQRRVLFHDHEVHFLGYVSVSVDLKTHETQGLYIIIKARNFVHLHIYCLECAY